MNSKSRPDQWLQYYEQQVQENAVNMTSSSESSLGGRVAAGRSSRASRRAKPTTLLNASPSNFRALVQQFTGRSSGGANSLRRRGPVTLDFESPSSVSGDDIFPRSRGRGYERSYDNTLHGVWPRREENDTGGKETTSYQIMGQESGLTFHGACDDHHDHGLAKEYSGSSSYGMDLMDYDDIHHNTALFEDFMMGDLDGLLSN